MRTLTDPDGSVNYIWELAQGQALEARGVQRQDDEFIVYVSSQTGCSQGCRMCHLTRTNQTTFRNVTPREFFEQVTTVLEAADLAGVKIVNINFMARGEPLENPHVNGALLQSMTTIIRSYGLIPRFKISTIMPRTIESTDLFTRFGAIQPDIYYSLYSTDPRFRNRWFPKAMNHALAITALEIWQQLSHKIPIIHFPMIAGQNDSRESIVNMVDALADLRCDYRIIRYNPFDEKDGDEGDWEGVIDFIASLDPGADVRVIQRIGPEAKASCGMFVEAP